MTSVLHAEHQWRGMAVGTPEILSTESKAMPVSIETTMGQLVLDFERIRFAMDTGQEIDYRTIEKTCEQYWTEWQTKAEPDAGADGPKARRGSA